MIEKSQRHLIDRPRYNYGAPNIVNNTKKQIASENKVTNNKIKKRRPVKRPTKPIENIKKTNEVKLDITTSDKEKVNKKINKPTNNKNDDGIFNQLKDKFITKSKDKGGNN